jgi:RES domain-containing protein
LRVGQSGRDESSDLSTTPGWPHESALHRAERPSLEVRRRWNSKGVRAVYCSLDPSPAILEVAVHKTFRTLDIVPHILTSIRVADPTRVRDVPPGDVPNANWLRPGIPSAGQQAFGDALLARHPFVVIPSAVSTHSWNLIFIRSVAGGHYSLVAQEPFALDTRLHPPAV